MKGERRKIRDGSRKGRRSEERVLPQKESGHRRGSGRGRFRRRKGPGLEMMWQGRVVARGRMMLRMDRSSRGEMLPWGES